MSSLSILTLNSPFFIESYPHLLVLDIRIVSLDTWLKSVERVGFFSCLLDSISLTVTVSIIVVRAQMVGPHIVTAPVFIINLGK